VDVTGRVFVSGGAMTAFPFTVAPTAPDLTCPGLATGPTATSCAAGTPFSSQIVSSPCLDVGSAAVTAVDGNGQPISAASATTNGDGSFALCLPADAPFSVEVTAPSFLPTYAAESLNLDAGASGFLPQLIAVPSDVSGELAAASSSFDPTKAIVAFQTEAFGLGSFLCAQNGWSFGLTLPDGGAVPDGGYDVAYYDQFVLNLAATATDFEGIAYIYNLDPTLSSFYVVSATNPDAVGCAPLNQSLGMTGRIFVAGGAATSYPVVLP
jgi:hypothetical protein